MPLSHHGHVHTRTHVHSHYAIKFGSSVASDPDPVSFTTTMAGDALSIAYDNLLSEAAKEEPRLWKDNAIDCAWGG